MKTHLSPLLYVATALLVLTLGAAALGVHFNLTPSLPLGLYRYTDESIRPSETIVTFCPPENISSYALDRGYLHKGSCPGRVQPLGKYVLAVAGDTVRLRTDGVTVNGSSIPESAVYDRDSMGRELPHYPFGTHIIGPDSVWMFSGHHPRSFDSRYFGPVPRSSIISVARPLWVTD